MKQIKHKSADKLGEFLTLIKHKDYFELSAKERKTANELIKENKLTFCYALNPYFLTRIQPKIKTYFLFIDARRADYYFQLKEYLSKKQKAQNIYLTTGDADIVISYSCIESVHNTIKSEVMNILQKISIENNDELIQPFIVNKQIILKGKICHNVYNGPEMSFDETTQVSNIICAYNSEKTIKKFGSEKTLKAFIKELKEDDIIEHPYVLHKNSGRIKSLTLILYTAPGFEKLFSVNKEVSKNIVDLYEVAGEHIADPFFQRANFAVLAEFNSMIDYHHWKERIYSESIKIQQNINFMTYVVENTMSEISQTVGDIREFEEHIQSYENGDGAKVELGLPFYFDEVEESKSISLNTDYLKDQGMIIGYMSSGKTFTAVELSKRFFELGIRTHFIDCTGGIQKKVAEDFNELIEGEKVAFFNVKELNNENIVLNENKINIYNVDEDKYVDFVKKVLEKITSHEDSSGRKTTDIIFFEEAHKLFNDQELTKKIFQILKYAGRKGFSLWFSTQRLQHFPFDNGQGHMVDDLKNRIIHKIDPSEIDNIADFMASGNSEVVFTLKEELKNITIGQALVSFYNENKQLRPIKIKITKK